MHVVATLQNGLHSAGLIIFLTCHNSLRAECESPTLVYTSFPLSAANVSPTLSTHHIPYGSGRENSLVLGLFSSHQ